MSKAFRVAFWRNQYKVQGDNRPDLTGQLQIPLSAIYELIQAAQAGHGVQTDQYQPEPFISLRVSAWQGTTAEGPILSGEVRTLVEAAQVEAEKAARAQQQGQPQAAPGYAPQPQPPQPGYGYPQPPQYQPPAAPQPPQYAPPQPQPPQYAPPQPQQPAPQWAPNPAAGTVAAPQYAPPAAAPVQLQQAPPPIQQPAQGGWSNTPGV